MPTYEYRCPKGHTFEVFQKMSDEPGATCPECGEAAERLISAGAGFLFKGEGFYITDYRSESYRKKAEAEKGGGKGEGGKGSAGAEGSGGASAGEGSSGSGGGKEASGSGGGKGSEGGSAGSGGAGGGTSSGGAGT